MKAKGFELELFTIGYRLKIVSWYAPSISFLPRRQMQSCCSAQEEEQMKKGSLKGIYLKLFFTF